VRIVKTPSEPAILVVPLAEMKEHLRLTDTDHDTYVTGLIQAAQQSIEAATNRGLTLQTYQMYRDGKAAPWLPGHMQSSLDHLKALTLFPVPVVSVASVKYLDFNQVQQTWDPALYIADLTSFPARITPGYCCFWPFVLPVMNAIVLEYTAGYDPTTGGVETVGVNAGGTGYSVNDVLTITGGGGTGATLKILTIDSGKVGEISILTSGSLYSMGTNLATTVAPPGGTGCTIDILTLATNLPRGLRHAVKFLVAHWFENRETVGSGTGAGTELPKAFDYLIQQYRIHVF
jgi:uncharacterized phiE125 gp8 family phage protein